MLSKYIRLQWAGFIVWDAGLYFTLILGAWALTRIDPPSGQQR